MRNISFAWLIFIPVIISCGRGERDYLRLHHDSLVADMHSDTPLKMRRGIDFAEYDSIGHMDLPRLIKGGIDLQVLACFISTDTPADSCRPPEQLLITLNLLKRREIINGLIGSPVAAI
jgi:hypothetical protein